MYVSVRMYVKYHGAYLTCGCFSPTRAGVFFVTRMDGVVVRVCMVQILACVCVWQEYKAAARFGTCPSTALAQPCASMIRFRSLILVVHCALPECSVTTSESMHSAQPVHCTHWNELHGCTLYAYCELSTSKCRLRMHTQMRRTHNTHPHTRYCTLRNMQARASLTPT